MKYLIFSFCYETPHLETDLEIAKKILDKNHEVIFLVCNSQMKSCFLNPYHNKLICDVCKSKILNGINKLGRIKILYLSKTIDLDFSFLQNIKTLDDLRQFQYKNCDVGLGVVSSLVSITRDHQFEIHNYKNLIKDCIETSILIYENFVSIINNYSPDAVILFNGRFLETKPIIHLCQKNKIIFFTHERGGQLNRYMYRENSTPHSLDFSKIEMELLWNDVGQEKIKIGENFFLERRNKIMQNWHVYNKSQNIGMLPPNFDFSKKNIAIFNSSIDEYVTIPDFVNKIYFDDNEGIKLLCESFSNDTNYHFYLRNHPNLQNLNTSQTREISLFKSKFKNLTVIEASDEIDSYALMENVDIVVTFGSTMGIEALYWGTPSILLGRSYFEDIEGIFKPSSHEEACYLLRQPLKRNLNRSNALKYGYWSLMYGVPFEYFLPKSLFKGLFLGTKIKANFYKRLSLKFYYFSKRVLKII